MVLKKKFSASQFWDDCRRHNVTIIIYIGELFRYLLAQPPNPKDTEHKVRAAFGNGLRKDIWTDVTTRFGLKKICENFASTEGSGAIFNNVNRPGAIGRMSPVLNYLDKEQKALVKFDYTTATPTRDSKGRCMKVAIGEPGLFLSQVPEQWLRSGRYSVYSGNQEASEKKLVRNAFVEGDIYFNFGDVFVLDSDYFVYFHDRIGDTFRWKGENVSTTEVTNQISSLPYIRDANVYGVLVPGQDGRAGMVALTLKDDQHLGKSELQQLYTVVCEKLPKYARPLFIRHLGEEDMTSTFKQRKVDLVTQAFDLDKVKDPLFYLDTEGGTYSPLTASSLDRFLATKL